MLAVLFPGQVSIILRHSHKLRDRPLYFRWIESSDACLSVPFLHLSKSNVRHGSWWDGYGYGIWDVASGKWRYWWVGKQVSNAIRPL